MDQHEKAQQDLANRQMILSKSIESRTNSNSRQNGESKKKVKCPKWDKEELLESFCDRLLIGNYIDGSPNGKYHEFIDSLQETKEKRKGKMHSQGEK